MMLACRCEVEKNVDYNSRDTALTKVVPVFIGLFGENKEKCPSPNDMTEAKNVKRERFSIMSGDHNGQKSRFKKVDPKVISNLFGD